MGQPRCWTVVQESMLSPGCTVVDVRLLHSGFWSSYFQWGCCNSSCALCIVVCALFLEVVRCSLKWCVVRWSCVLIVSSQRHFPLSFLRRQWEGCRYLVTEPEISNLLGGSPKPSTHTHHRKFFCKHFIDCKPPQAPHPHEAGQNFSLRTFYQWQATPQLVGHKPSTQTPIHKSSPPCKTTSLQTLYCG